MSNEQIIRQNIEVRKIGARRAAIQLARRFLELQKKGPCSGVLRSGGRRRRLYGKFWFDRGQHPRLTFVDVSH